MTTPKKKTRWEQLRDDWGLMSIYQRFESIVAMMLTVVIGLVIVISLYHLGKQVIVGLVIGMLDPLDQNVFAAIFGEVLTVMIALEFNHTIQFVVQRSESIIQTKVVLLIALLALSRKIVLIDIETVGAGELIGLGVLVLSLGAVYWLMRERDDRLASVPKVPAG
jgi:uncharacterized membrane protein (DUF373 family)